MQAEDDDDEDSLDEEDRARSEYDRRGYIIRAPQLQRLSIKELFITRGSNYFDLLLRPLPRDERMAPRIVASATAVT